MTEPVTTIEAIATSCIAGRIRLLNRVITNLYDEALRPVGVKLSQGSVLDITAKLGIARSAEVCEILEPDTSTLSRNVDRMVEKGWLDVLLEEEDRSHPFRLTEQGRQLMDLEIGSVGRQEALG